MSWLLAHGIGGIRDLPVPRYVFFYGAAGRARRLVRRRSPSSGGSRCSPNASEAARFPPALQRCCSRRRSAGRRAAWSFGLLVFLWLGALIGRRTRAASTSRRRSSTSTSGSGWCSQSSCSATCGRCSSPWRAAADGAGWVLRTARAPRRAPFEYPEWLGRWPAAVLLLCFVTLELSNPTRPTRTRWRSRSRSTAASPGRERRCSGRRHGSQRRRLRGLLLAPARAHQRLRSP